MQGVCRCLLDYCGEYQGNDANGRLSIRATGRTEDGKEVALDLLTSLTAKQTVSGDEQIDKICTDDKGELTLDGKVVVRKSATDTITILSNLSDSSWSLLTINRLADGYAYAQDGYWVHLELDADFAMPSNGDPISNNLFLTITDSDGYVLTLDYGLNTGSLECKGEKVADITIDEDYATMTVSYLAGGEETVPTPVF